MPETLVVCFWISVVLVVYTYLAYPIAIYGLAHRFGRPPGAPIEQDHARSASLILAAHDEASVIAGRLDNALSMEDPGGGLEIVVGADGCSDRTAEIARGFADRHVRVLEFSENRGKASVLNDLVAASRGEILIMSDANTYIDTAAAKNLLRWFADPTVGVVVGRLVLVDPITGKNADGLYWKYETFLKTCEAKLGALLGANGAIYAIRRDLYEPIPAATIVDDFVIPLLAKQRTDCAIVYDRSAVAEEETAPSVGSEFHRRTRIGAGGYQSIGMLWRLLDPRRGWIAFAFLSHKILRWLCPFFMLGTLACNIPLASRPFYLGTVTAQVAFYAVAVAMMFVPAKARGFRLLRLTTMFTLMNVALFVGFWRWLFGRQRGAWKRTSRFVEAGGAGR